MKYDIFISYRRVGGKEKARPLKSELEKNGYKVFLDFDDLKDGVFDKRIMDAIDSAPIFLIILSKDSLVRCKNEDDWVRKEIEYAISKNKHFVPVNPDREFTDFPVDIPEEIKDGLGQHQFSTIDFEQLFQVSFDKMLKERIEPILAKIKEEEKSNRGALIRIETDLDCRVLRFKEEIAIAKSDDITKIRLPKGTHKLTFEGLENSEDTYSIKYEVTDLDYEYYIEVRLLDKYNARKAEKTKAEQERLEREKQKRLEQERLERERRDAEERKRKEAEAKQERLKREKQKNNSNTINGHKYVDLGLPSGLKWATCNVGANKPEEYGDYYAWGETSTKDSYRDKNYKYCSKRFLIYKYDSIGNISGNSQYDAARANWGGTWRLPTMAEFEELRDKCNWRWTTQNGKNGYKVTGPNGNSIFLPAAGYRDGTSLNNAGSLGYYWSSTPHSSDDAYYLFFNSSSHNVSNYNRYYGYTVRPVRE